MPKLITPTRPLADMPDLLTADEAAPYLRMSGRNARRLIADGDLDHILVQFGAKRFVSRRLLAAALAGEMGDTVT